MYPLILEVQKSKIPSFVWNTGQSRDNFWNQYHDFGFSREHAFCLDEQAQDLSSRGTAARWFLRNLLKTKSKLQKELQTVTGITSTANDLCFVHGDTLSTVMGCRFARKLGLRIAHVEAGMRSGDWREPFPEEINRRLTSGWADFHFAPDDNAAQNLRREKRKGEIVVTGGNTVVDALRKAVQTIRPLDLPVGAYAVANLHRYENLHNETKWTQMIDVVCEAARNLPVCFVMHPPTEMRLQADARAQAQLKAAKVQLFPRMTYLRYVHLMNEAQYLLTDSGSNQQESSFLGVPCLLLRERTESLEGLGQNVILSEFKSEVIRDFITNPSRFRRPTLFPKVGPTQIIIDKLKTYLAV